MFIAWLEGSAREQIAPRVLFAKLGSCTMMSFVKENIPVLKKKKRNGLDRSQTGTGFTGNILVILFVESVFT